MLLDIILYCDSTVNAAHHDMIACTVVTYKSSELETPVRLVSEVSR